MILSAAACAILPLLALGQRVPEASAPRFPAGTYGRLAPKAVDSLRALLARPESTWADARKFYFRTTYLPGLPDVMVYIDSGYAIRQALIHHERVSTARVLRSEKYIYVLVFTDSPLVRVERDSAKGPQALRISRTAVDYQADPFVVMVLKGFGAKLFGATPVPRATAVADTGVQLTLDSVGTGLSWPHPLYSALVRFPLAEETWNRVHIAGARGWELHGGTTIVTNFGNASASRFGVSIAGGLTYNARMQALKDTVLVPTGEHLRASLYLLSHFYLLRPSLPWSRRSLALTVGTNLARGDPLNDIVAGVTVGRLIGDMGVTVGANALPSKLRDGSDTRRIRPFASLDFHL